MSPALLQIAVFEGTVRSKSVSDFGSLEQSQPVVADCFLWCIYGGISLGRGGLIGWLRLGHGAS